MAKDFAKSKCFIKTDNGYEEITYEELLRREEADPSYKGRRFLPLHGMLMEVTPEQYRDFYKARRRQKYLYERSRENRDISIDMLTTEQFNGADILVSDGMDIEEQVAYKLLLDKLHSCLALLTEEEQELIYALFFGEKTEREWSAETGIPQKTIPPCSDYPERRGKQIQPHRDRGCCYQQSRRKTQTSDPLLYRSKHGRLNRPVYRPAGAASYLG